jgi:hypothetical protein
MIKQGYLWTKYFPMKTVYDFELTWDYIQAANPLAGLYSHDGVPIPGTDTDYEQRLVDISHVMASRTINQNTVMKLRQAGELRMSSGNSLVKSIRQRYLGKVAEKLASCQDEVDGTMEYLSMAALQGSIAWPPTTAAGGAIANPPASWGNIAFTLSMGFRANFVQDVSTLVGWNSKAGAQVIWSTVATANPIKDFQVIRELINKTTGLSARNATVIMGSDILSLMAENTEVLRWIRGTQGPAIESTQKFIDTNLLEDALKTRLGWNIETYDARWTYPTASTLGSESGVTHNLIEFLKTGKVIIIPEGALSDGYSYMASAPDMAGNMASGKDPDSGGLYTWSKQMDVPPWTAVMGVGCHCFPILKTVEEIFVLDVLN